MVRVVLDHVPSSAAGCFPKVFLVDNSVLVNDKSQYSADLILRRVSHQCEPSGQLLRHKIAHIGTIKIALFPSGSVLSLRRQDPKVATVERVGTRSRSWIPFLGRESYQRIGWAPFPDAFRFPVKAVLHSRVTRELLRVDPGHRVRVAGLTCVFFLKFHIDSANFNG